MRNSSRLAFALLSLLSAAPTFAGEPWWNDEGDCRRHWADVSEGCRIRRDDRYREQASIDLNISQAESKRDASVKPKQDAAVVFARLDEKHHDREDVFVPYLERTVRLCHELRDLLVVAAAPGVAR
ncbi:MAG: hypothetical protein HY074_13130, partial [Deltaproteobacteria bacterium]|nr:hypothetical protein [Deltaproteobacteria bacterium]